MTNLEHLIGTMNNKGVKHQVRRKYEWDKLRVRGDSLVFDADGHSKMDNLQIALVGAVRYREKRNPGEQYVTRRLKGNQIAIIKVR